MAISESHPVHFVDQQMKYVRRQIVTGCAVLRDLASPNLSPRMFFLDFFVYPPIILLCLFVAFDHSGLEQWLKSATLIVSGYWFWTLTEYVAHRFVLHRVPVFATLHKAHHDEPHALIGTPTIFSLVVFYCFAFWPVAEFDGMRPAASWFAGLLLGYFLYVTAHYIVHHVSSGGFRFVKKLKRQHALHHHSEADCNFGVTTSFWDRLFGTLSVR